MAHQAGQLEHAQITCVEHVQERHQQVRHLKSACLRFRQILSGSGALDPSQQKKGSRSGKTKHFKCHTLGKKTVLRDTDGFLSGSGSFHIQQVYQCQHFQTRNYFPKHSAVFMCIFMCSCYFSAHTKCICNFF
jgi:hypothetical protein